MIVIVGGGISGLTLAHELAHRGRDFVLLEASPRVGGVIRSDMIDGHLLEYGPQRARLTQPFAELVDELGLRDQLITAPPDLPLFIYADRRLRRVPFSVTGLITSDALSLRARARLLLEPLTAGARDHETVERYFTRKLGREAYERLAGPLYGGLYASDPADMIVGSSLANTLRDLGVTRSLAARMLRRRRSAVPPPCSFASGLETLPRALEQRLGNRVRLDTPVRAIESDGAGYVVVTDDEVIPAPNVVVTTSAGVAASLLRGVARSADRLESLRYNPLAVVHLHARTQLRGLGYQVALSEKLVTRGVTWNDSLFGRSGVYTAYLGGAANPRIVNEDDTRIGELAIEEFREVTGCDARAISVTRVRMPAWDRSWRGLADFTPVPGIHIHASWYARPGLPGRLAASKRLAAMLA